MMSSGCSRPTDIRSSPSGARVCGPSTDARCSIRLSDAAQARGARDDPEPARHSQRRGAPARHLEREHATERRHLPRGHIVTRVRRKPRIVHGAHSGVPGEEARDGGRVLAVRADPARQRARPAEHEPAVERRRHAAGQRLREPHPAEELVVRPGHHRAALHVAVAAEIFRRRVHDQVGAERERAHERRAGPGVVAGHERAGPMRELGHRGYVGDAQQRIRRRLDPDQARGRLQRAADRAEIGEVHRPRAPVPSG